MAGSRHGASAVKRLGLRGVKNGYCREMTYVAQSLYKNSLTRQVIRANGDTVDLEVIGHFSNIDSGSIVGYLVRYEGREITLDQLQLEWGDERLEMWDWPES